MQRIEINVPLEAGMSIEAVGAFALAAVRFESVIRLQCGEQIVNGKSILGLSSVAYSWRAPVVLMAEGPDEQEALEYLSEFLKRLCGHGA